MRVTLTDKLVGRRTSEGNTVAFIASFYDDSSDTWVASTPTTVRYRLDEPETGREVIGWTSVTPATSATISLPGTSLTTDVEQAKVELTVQANAGLSSQYQVAKRFHITGLIGQ